MKTIKGLLKEACSQILQLDAQVLLAQVLKVDRAYLYTHPEQTVDKKSLEQFLDFLKRRAQGEPVAYILGFQEFWSLNFKVTPDVLIPRPETEHLVEAVLNHVKADSAQIADLGTGSGAIACALAHERPNWQLIAVDQSFEALQVAKINILNLKCPNVELVQASWLGPFKHKALDAIVSNPPYIEEGDTHLADLRYEPEHALVAKERGLADIRMIIKQAKKTLKPGGLLALEHGMKQGESVRDLLSKAFHQVQTFQDLAGLDRITIGYSISR